TYTGTYATSHIYDRSGQYEVCVTIKYDGGCQARRCQVASVIAGDATCTADFQVLNTLTNPRLKYFNPVLSNSQQNKPISVCWNFGDGSTEKCFTYAGTYTGTYATSHTYERTGQFEVCVTIRYDGGCQARKCQVVSVIAGDATCTADFQVLNSTSVTTGRYFSAIINNSLQKKPVKVCWKFGDGTPESCQTFSTTYTGSYAIFHTYAHAGEYEACITITYDGGCEAKKCKVVNVQAPTCPANFQVITAASSTNLKYFNVLLADSIHLKPLQVCWKFGDGTADVCHTYAGTYTGSYATSHQYANAGQYEACVTIKYDGGCEAKKCMVVSVLPASNTCEAKVYEASASLTTLERKYYAFLQTNRTADSICWNFGDGSARTCVKLSNPVDQQSLIATHNFPAPGNYRVCIRVVYSGGCVAERCLEVTVRPQSTSTCGGYLTQQLTTVGSVLFNGFSIHDPNDNPVQFNWTFGDGATGTGQQVNHTYTGTGPFRVCLSIRTTSGCETNVCTNVITASNAQPKLVLNPNPVAGTLHVTFISTRSETISIRIFNANGILLRTYTRTVAAGNNTWDVDVSNLPTGVYSMVIQSANQFATAIFFKQ
ncbi:MAG: PKD domain-containing protein, partial [Candidatus Dadabacteria bacterium]